MKMSTIFSKHLKADDLGTSTPTVTIDRVELEKVGDNTKPILYFRGKDKGVVLNVTNTNTLTEILGTDESDDWTGQRVQLYTTKVDYAGKRVLAIRIREAPARPAFTPVANMNSQQAAPPPLPPMRMPEPVPAEDIFDEGPDF